VTPVKTSVNVLGTEATRASARATDLVSPQPSRYGISAVVTLGENQITGVNEIGWELTGSFPPLRKEQPAHDKASANTTQTEMTWRHDGK
jgi:hypothetical protein